MSSQVTLRALNRATLHRQSLLERANGTVAEVVGRLAGLQAQHANQPYIALWSRRHGQTIADLELALTGRDVVKASLMRTTLHLVAAADYRALDVLTARPRLATWEPSARRAGLDLAKVNAQVRDFCAVPRTVAEIEEHLARLHPDVDAAAQIPGGVRNAWFRLSTAGGGVVHVPPSGLWNAHGRPGYVDDRQWLGNGELPEPDAAVRLAVERFLTAYGPASVADIVKWAGQRQVRPVRDAVAAMGDRVVRYQGPDGRELVDLAELDPPDPDADAPARFLSRWDSVLIAYDARDRILPAEHMAAVVKKNGDFLPSFLVGGFVAGLWSVTVTKGRATLRLEPFGTMPVVDRRALEAEAERLVRYVQPEAEQHDVVWA